MRSIHSINVAFKRKRIEGVCQMVEIKMKMQCLGIRMKLIANADSKLFTQDILFSHFVLLSIKNKSTMYKLSVCCEVFMLFFRIVSRIFKNFSIHKQKPSFHLLISMQLTKTGEERQRIWDMCRVHSDSAQLLLLLLLSPPFRSLFNIECTKGPRSFRLSSRICCRWSKPSDLLTYLFGFSFSVIHSYLYFFFILLRCHSFAFSPESKIFAVWRQFYKVVCNCRSCCGLQSVVIVAFVPIHQCVGSFSMQLIKYTKCSKDSIWLFLFMASASSSACRVCRSSFHFFCQVKLCDCNFIFFRSCCFTKWIRLEIIILLLSFKYYMLIKKEIRRRYY